jgi:membrane protein
VGTAWKCYLLVLRNTFVATFEDRGFGVAKAAAYSALLSFFPVLTTAAAILVQINAVFVSRTVTEFLFQVIPPGTEELVRYQLAVQGHRPTLLLVLAAVLSVWAASGVIGSLMQGFQAAYQIPGRSFFRGIGVSMMLVVFSGVPLLAACGLMFFGNYIDRLVMYRLDPWQISPVTEVWHLFTRITRYVVAFSAAVAVTMLLYYFGPYRRQTWKGVWRGAIFATILWLLATGGFGWYVRNIANYNVLYRSIATSITLLVWMYLMSIIALLGCEFNAQYERVCVSSDLGGPSTNR